MRALSWNVNKSANSAGRIDDQLEVLEAIDPDIILLQEVRYGADQQWVDVWKQGLEEFGIGEIEHSCDWAAALADSSVPPHDHIGHDNGHLTAVRSEWDLTREGESITDQIASSDFSHAPTSFPEKIHPTQHTTDDQEIEVWNVRAVPGGMWGEEKIKIFETVFDRLTEAGPKMRILAGDFNTPDSELRDRQAIPFGYNKQREIRQRWANVELSILKGLGHLNMEDVFRAVNGYGEIDQRDTSWKSKRFDHIFASQSLDVEDCFYDCSGLDCSDHAPIVADFTL